MRFASPSRPRAFATLVALLAGVPLVAGCESSPADPDAGAQDSGVVDQGDSDQGGTDQGGPDEALSACLADVQPGPNAAYMSTNHFRTADGSVELAFIIQPDPDAFGTSGTTPFLPLALAARVDGELYCITNAAELDYAVSHHNFDDTLAFTLAGDAYTWKVDIVDYDNFPTYSLTVVPAAGATTEEALVALGCSVSTGDYRCFGPETW